MKIGENKRCPRCNMKVYKHAVICPNCQLNFDKFNEATNAKAKEVMHDHPENVILRKGFPIDVAKWKLLLITIFLGFTGAHYYRVGRYKMGLFFTAFFLVGVINGILAFIFDEAPSGEVWEIFNLMVLIWGVVILIWLFDIAKVIFNQFKIPVSR